MWSGQPKGGSVALRAHEELTDEEYAAQFEYRPKFSMLAATVEPRELPAATLDMLR